MGIVIDESFFDQKGKIVLGETQSTRLAGLLDQAGGHGMSHAGDEAAILLIEDVFFFA